jgi:predicted esterase
MVSGSLDPVSDLCAWVLFPTGVTPWSGDDWHNWGFADVEAAIEAIPAWIEHVGWRGPSAETNRWIVSGHSNGGQGTWYALTHRPDNIVAAAPVSGYASIQKYVTYELWQPADPRRTAVISASLNSYRHEMLMPNARGIPIQQQHGEIDDNVPAFNSRLLSQQLYLSGASSDYLEVPGQSHWWDTVMTTADLVDFYYKQTKNEDVLPRKLDNFTIIVGDPGDMGSKNGIKVKHLEDPGQYGKVNVKGRTITTSNVQELEFDPALWKESISLDESQLELADMSANSNSPISACKLDHHWYLVTAETRTKQIQRSERQLGSMTAILRSQGPFVIRHPDIANTSHLAIQISRNLHQYLQADTVIVSSPSYSVPADTTGNVITLAVGSSLDDTQPAFPVLVSESGVTVRGYRGQEQQYGEEARSAAFLRPLKGESERLDLVLWGADNEGLRQAMRMVPMIAGVGQPDFVILGESAKWKGVEGALAMGFFDSKWEVTPSSVVESS